MGDLPLGEVPHEGGLRLGRTTKSYEFLRDWVAEGAKDDPKAPAAVKLEILPGARVLNAPAKSGNRDSPTLGSSSARSM